MLVERYSINDFISQLVKRLALWHVATFPAQTVTQYVVIVVVGLALVLVGHALRLHTPGVQGQSLGPHPTYVVGSASEVVGTKVLP